MKKEHKPFIIKAAVIFFAVLGVLTYFSKTIENTLLPQVRTDMISTVTDENDPSKSYILVPKSAVSRMGDEALFYMLPNGSDRVYEVFSEIVDEDDLYYIIADDYSVLPGSKAVWYTNKELHNNDKVYVLEDTE